MRVSTVPGPGSGAAWPGVLVGRAGSVLAAIYRGRRGAVGDAALLGAAALVLIGHPQTLAMSVVLPLALLATVPLAAARRRPTLGLGAVLVANSVFILFGRLSWPIPAVAGWLVALGLCPLLLTRRAALTAFVSCEVVVACAAILSSPHNFTPWDATAAEALAVLTAWGLGESLRVRRRSAAEQDAAASLVRQLRERDALARERAAIARELHDVVAHHVSMIAVRAATAPYAEPGLTPPARAVLDEIAGQARTALAELRTILGVLREGGGGLEHSPQPGLDELPELARRVCDSGTPVTLATAGSVRPLPEPVELCCYRIVQESLTNIGRHAPGSRAVVELDYREDCLAVTVRDDGSGGSGAGAGAGTVGFGLLGMRERVAVLGGSLNAGRDPEGGFVVAARLPLAPDANVDVDVDANVDVDVDVKDVSVDMDAVAHVGESR